MSESLQDSLALIKKPENLAPEKKRKQSAAEELPNCKKSRNSLSLNEVINLVIL